MQSRHTWWTLRTVAARTKVTAIGGHKITPHTFRRTYATDLLNRGVRLEVVSRLLGHSTTAVTEKFYAHLSDARLRAELEAAFITSPSPRVPHGASQARPLDPAELAAHYENSRRRWSRNRSSHLTSCPGSAVGAQGTSKGRGQG
jgi:hypothetical protein